MNTKHAAVTDLKKLLFVSDKEEKLKDKEVNEEMVEKQEAISEKEQEEGEPIEEKQTSETAETQPEDDEVELFLV